MDARTQIEIGSLPEWLQQELSDFCFANRKQKLLTTVEKWPMHQIVEAYLMWNGIHGRTYEVVKLLEALIVVAARTP